MTRAQSTAVVNDAAAMQSQIDALLNAPIMEWDNSPEIDWVPGDSLWAHPADREMIGQVDSDGDPYFFQGGNHARPMFQIIGRYLHFVGFTPEIEGEERRPIYDEIYGPDDCFDSASIFSDFRVQCEDCGVGWGPEETDCWMCGKTYPRLSGHRGITFPGARWEGLTHVAAQAAGRVERMSQDMRGLHVHFTLNDEFTAAMRRQRQFTENLFASLWGGQQLNFFSSRRMGRSSLQSMWVDEWTGDHVEDFPERLVRLQVTQVQVDRLPPVPRVLQTEVDLGLSGGEENEPATLNTVVSQFIRNNYPRFESGPRYFVLHLPEHIPTPEVPPAPRLEISDGYVRPELVVGTQYPSSNPITQQRRRRHI